MSRQIRPRVSLFALLIAAPVAAQAPNLTDRGQGPVQVDAENGIEWRRDEKLYIASGKAIATRGDTKVNGDRLIARYREDADGKTTVFKLEAEGKLVTIHSGTSVVYGERAVYDVDRGVLTLVGRNLCLTTGGDVVTARDSLEYWEKSKLAIARGNAVATRDDRRAAADTLVAHVAEAPAAPGPRRPPVQPAASTPLGTPPAASGSRIEKIDAHGNVRISSAGEVATGNAGTYNLDSNIAHLLGNVKVTQGRNQLNGEYGEVNFTTGVSRMLSGPAAGRAGERVRGLLHPDDKKSPATPAAVPAGTPLPMRACK